MKAFEQNIRKVEPYVPGEQPQRKVIKLNTNENPYPPSPAVARALADLAPDRLRLYPDPAAAQLVHAIAAEHGVKESQVFPGVGSDDVLSMCFLTFFNGSQPVLFPDVTYSFYKVWAALYRTPYETVPLNEDYTVDTDGFIRPNGGVILPNPNAPTGIYEDLDGIEKIIKANQDVIVIIDEAYIDFAGPSAAELLDKYENLLVVRTFSKSHSLAGMRIGYALGSETLVHYLNNTKYSFNSYTLNTAAIVCGAASLQDKTYFIQCRDRIISTREKTGRALQELGFAVLPSQANFVFARHGKYDAKELFAMLKEQGIYVRYFDQPRTDQFLRITIGTDEEMAELFACLKNYLQK